MILGSSGVPASRFIRVVIDAVSSILVLNQPEAIYKFVDQLLSEIKRFDSALLAILEEGMHKPEVLAARQQLFDGVLELRSYEEGLRVLPLPKIRKMRDLPPLPGHFNFSFSRPGMNVSLFG